MALIKIHNGGCYAHAKTSNSTKFVRMFHVTVFKGQ